MTRSSAQHLPVLLRAREAGLDPGDRRHRVVRRRRSRPRDAAPRAPRRLARDRDGRLQRAQPERRTRRSSRWPRHGGVGVFIMAAVRRALRSRPELEAQVAELKAAGLVASRRRPGRGPARLAGPDGGAVVGPGGLLPVRRGAARGLVGPHRAPSTRTISPRTRRRSAAGPLPGGRLAPAALGLRSPGARPRPLSGRHPSRARMVDFCHANNHRCCRADRCTEGPA